jgi:seryl-tRNA synthetase
MLDIQFIRDNKELVQKNADVKGRSVDITELLRLDEERRTRLVEVEQLNSLKNDINQLIQNATSAEERAEIIEKGKEIKAALEKAEPLLRETELAYTALIKKVPNVATEDTPVGKDDSENVVIKTVGEVPSFAFAAREHFEIGKDLDLIDSETAANLAGARFAYLKGDLVRMQYALVQLVLETLTSSEALQEIADANNLTVPVTPFTPIIPPVFIRPEVFDKMDRLEPKEDKYYLAEDDLYLTGSAEHGLGPIHMNQILDEAQLPIRYIGYNTAFRREAGTYGKDMKGLIRTHQFDKLEMESFAVPEMGLDEQNFIVAIQEHLLQLLELPYQVMAVCTGDMGKPDARQIDINTWLPGQNQYRETNTSDYMTDYQARRLMIRVRRTDGSLEYAHMNDATAFAIGRILVAILENYQEEDGSVRIPKVLQPYLGGKQKIGAGTA